MYPFRFEPIYQKYVWGGERIFAYFHRKKPGKGPFAESWEVSDRQDAMSIVASGPRKGSTLSSLIQEFGPELLGTKCQSNRFPLLVKIIDAKENLSVQVHPDATKAKEFQGEPKTECWVALKESSVLAGLKQGTTRDLFEEAIDSQTLENHLCSLSLKPGQALYLPARRVHAILSGSFLYEVQQNSNTTYRLYDWGRVGRKLHLKEGLSTIDWEDFEPTPSRTHKTILEEKNLLIERVIESPFFQIDRIKVKDLWENPPFQLSFQLFFCLQGQGLLQSAGFQEKIEPGMSYLIPASLKVVFKGNLELIRTVL